jgi:hypothetical protein
VLVRGNLTDYKILGVSCNACLRVDEVASGRNEGVKKLKGGLLVHGAQHALPGFAQAHGTELQRRDSDACCLGEDSVPTQRSGWLGCGLEK